MRLKQHALTAATLVMIGAAAVGCGGDDKTSASASDSSSSASSDPSASASDAGTADFCTGLTSTTQITNGKEVAAFVNTLQALDLPSDAPAEASEGFDIYVKALGTVDESATTAELKKMGDLGLSADDKTKVQSFLAYAAQACSPQTSESPSPSPSK
ncbi:hypothetical protein H5V45_13975 [Nocardioides sp. KIGAM211]|uniref:DUF732 domain-containing protein n=1 Tax=Nocardioides luti TaxID=2761101 RepID=A0A7X0RHL4_9ACTN|nr:hypothetical protein [Nocardioides luti]MBB6628431.1 hypothetical protein [Nocardioides luti]